MQRDSQKLANAGVKIVGISYDPVETLHRFAEKQKITFPLLSDPDSKTIVAYAIRNKEMAGKALGKIKLDGVPYPGTFVVDQQGIIRAKLFLEGYKDRHSTEALLEAAGQLKKEPKKK